MYKWKIGLRKIVENKQLQQTRWFVITLAETVSLLVKL